MLENQLNFLQNKVAALIDKMETEVEEQNSLFTVTITFKYFLFTHSIHNNK